MNDIAEPISRGQYLWMVSVSVVAGGIYLWPQYLVEHAGSNGVYSLATTTAIAVAMTLLQVAIALDVPKPTFLGVLREIFPVGGLALVFPVTAGLCLATDGVILGLYGLMMKEFFYPMTPALVMDAFIVLSAVWIAGRTLSAVGRVVQFWFPIILLLFVLIVALSLKRVSFLDALTPSGHFYVAPWLNTVSCTWYTYANGAVVVTLTRHVRWKRPRDAYTTAGAAILAQATVLATFYTIGLATIGPDALSRLYWPLVYVFGLVSIHTFFLKGIGVFTVMIWTSSVVLYLTVHLFCFGWSVSGQWPRASAWLRWGVVGASAAAVLGVVQTVPSVLTARLLLFHYIAPADLGWVLVTAPLLWLLSVGYRRRKRL